MIFRLDFSALLVQMMITSSTGEKTETVLGCATSYSHFHPQPDILGGEEKKKEIIWCLSSSFRFYWIKYIYIIIFL